MAGAGFGSEQEGGRWQDLVEGAKVGFCGLRNSKQFGVLGKLHMLPHFPAPSALSKACSGEDADGE